MERSVTWNRIEWIGLDWIGCPGIPGTPTLSLTRTHTYRHNVHIMLLFLSPSLQSLFILYRSKRPWTLESQRSCRMDSFVVTARDWP